MIPDDLDRHFERYTSYDPLVPVWNVTGNTGGCFHRFFDTSPISPSGRYLVVTRYADETRLPDPGEPAEVVLFDLHKGGHRVVAKTYGWDTQLGAQAQWGADDTQLFFNDMDTASWRPFGVCMNPLTGEYDELEGTVYMASTDGRYLLSPCLLRTGLTQAGYGVIAPEEVVPVNQGAPEDDGVTITDTRTGKSRLLVSLKQILTESMQPGRFGEGDFYTFHVKWNRQGTRAMVVVRWVPRDGTRMRPNLITMKADGTDIANPIPDSEWADKGGHHPNWCPDGEHVLINLRMDGPETPMRLVSAMADGSQYGVMSLDIVGSGHPSLHPDARHVITDAYLHESLAFGDGTTPLRWMDLRSGEVKTVVRLQTEPAFSGPKRERRVDPHPAWDRSWRYVAFNGCPEGVRSVFIADLGALLDS